MISANHIIVGHTPVRCKKPVAEDEGGIGSGGGGGDTGAFDTGDSMAGPTAEDEHDWGVPAAEPSTAAAW